jgi:hypothetical protein
MSVSRNFVRIKLRPGGTLVIEGENEGDEAGVDESTVDLRVMLVSRPDYAHIVSVSNDGVELTRPTWELVIPDAPAPFETPGQEILVIGFAKYDDEEGAPQQHIWAAEMWIG